MDLGIKNPNCVAYDILFGCPGWVQGVIQADTYFKAGVAKKALVVGTETLSRVLDMYDRDSMIFSDGAGASVLEARNGDKQQRHPFLDVCKAIVWMKLITCTWAKAIFPEATPISAI